MKRIQIKQIIVATDGKSNVGGNPITAASEAIKEGIVVNAIGIVNHSNDEDDSFYEVKQIAKAGGGIWEYSMLKDLGRSMHVVTQTTVNKTIHTIVGNQLKEIIGGDIEDIPPKSRGEVISYMEKLEEEAQVLCCIVIDCSGSMKNKMSTARQSIIELMNSLQARKGDSQVAVISYPGQKGEMTKLISDFTQDIGELKERIFELKAGGPTPTAAAICKAIRLIKDYYKEEVPKETDIEQEALMKESML